MRLEKFRIQNYKSIIDSGFCWLASDITILAGKNESGKSGILEAIRDFSKDITTLPQSAIPLNESGKTVIELYFHLDPEDRKTIIKKCQLSVLEAEKLLPSHFGLYKNENGEYFFTSDITTPYVEYINKNNNPKLEQIDDSLNKISNCLKSQTPTIPKYRDIDQFSKDLDNFFSEIERRTYLLNLNEESQSILNKLIVSIRATQKELKTYKSYYAVIKELLNIIPKIIFFSDFTDILPFSINFHEAQSNTTVKNFADISGLNLTAVLNTDLDTQRRMNLLKKSSVKISGDFKDYWAQEELKLMVTSDGNKLLFSVEEKGRPEFFKPEQRSKGFQWFLSFYLRLAAERGNTNIILIDEPGLYVHAKAQKDILAVLESLSKDMQIIFSTHSPYLIDNKRLDRVRLVKKDKKGSTIENKIHKNADKETLTPIITAIGLDISNSFNVIGQNNILLEGISDYYFLNGMLKRLGGTQLNNKFLVPCTGATKIPIMVSLIMGWGLNFVAVLDNDPEGIRVGKDLKRKYLLDDKNVLYVSNISNSCIEDLFSKEDFYKYVTNSPSPTVKISNSDYVSQKKLDKPILSKHFFENVNRGEQIDLSDETVSNFTDLFMRIESAF